MFIEMLLQLLVNVRLSSQHAPQQESDATDAEGNHSPPRSFVLAAERLVHVPGLVTAFAGGELYGL